VRRLLPAALAGVLALAVTACAGPAAPTGDAISAASGRATPSAAAPSRSAAAPSPSGAKAPSARPDGGTAVLAFGGDVHFEGSSAGALSGRLGSAFSVLRSADLAMVNLETAVTQRGNPEPKDFTFRAPARAFTALRQAGVDVVSLANNHGMDFGRTGLADTLDAAERARMPLLGAGRDDDEAWAPLRREVEGVRVSVLAATDVLDDFAISSWVARAGTPGLASAKDPDRLLAAVRAERDRADVVVVFLHWGRERVVCPTARQLELARMLSQAGADVVVGSHAHVLLGSGRLDDTYVNYGLGNFLWYNQNSIDTGVLQLRIRNGEVLGDSWTPARIQPDGRPQIVPGPARAAEIEDWRRLQECAAQD
jgi:poly-gamma-glutamate synthesis protein (capsule biosynthesis protein)